MAEVDVYALPWFLGHGRKSVSNALMLYINTNHVDNMPVAVKLALWACRLLPGGGGCSYL
jgi:hypothetical protein